MIDPNEAPESTLKCYKTYVCGFTSYVLAIKRSHAMLTTLSSANECGYEVKFVDIKATRFKDFDHLANGLPCSRKLRRNTPYTHEYMSNPCGCTKCSHIQGMNQQDIDEKLNESLSEDKS